MRQTIIISRDAANKPYEIENTKNLSSYGKWMRSVEINEDGEYPDCSQIIWNNNRLVFTNIYILAFFFTGF